MLLKPRIITPHTRPFTQPMIQEYAALGLDKNKIELLCVFDRSGSSKLLDVSGNQRHGTISGATWEGVGRYGQALTCDGIEDNVDFGDILNFTPSTTPFSVVFWTRRLIAATDDIVGKQVNSDGEGWKINTTSGGSIRMTLRDNAGNFQRRVGPTLTVDGIVHQVVYTYDGSESSAGMNAYFDGVLTNGAATDSGSVVSIANSITLQLGSNGDQKHYGGIFDLLLIYSAELNASQIANMFRAGL